MPTAPAARALAEPAHLIEQAVADQVAPVQLGIVIPAGVFRCGLARGPQLPQRDLQPVQVRGCRDLVHPRRESLAAAASVRIETPSARAKASAQLRSRAACSRRQAAHDARSSILRSRPLHAEVLLMGWERAGRAVRAGDVADGPDPPFWPAGQPVVPISRRTVSAAPAPASTAA